MIFLYFCKPRLGIVQDEQKAMYSNYFPFPFLTTVLPSALQGPHLQERLRRPPLLLPVLREAPRPLRVSTLRHQGATTVKQNRKGRGKKQRINEMHVRITRCFLGNKKSYHRSPVPLLPSPCRYRNNEKDWDYNQKSALVPR